MPWSASEASSHTKSAKSPAQKKKWAAIANSALQTQLKNGKSQSEAEGYAIRVANSAMGDAYWERGTFDGAFFAKQMKELHDDESFANQDPNDPDWDPDDPDIDPDDPDHGDHDDDEDRMRRHSGDDEDEDEDEDDDNGPDDEEQYSDADNPTAMYKCPECDGKKFIHGSACEACGGKGFIPEDERMRRNSAMGNDSDYRKPYVSAKYDANFSAKQRRRAIRDGHAMKRGGFPIIKKSDVAAAQRMVDRAKVRSAAVSHINKRAKALGVRLEEGWHLDQVNPPRLIAGGGHVVGDSVTTVRMYDTVSLDDKAGVRELENGYISAKPRIARTGIQVYAGVECGMPNMDTVRVYRPPNEVFAKDSIHSYTHLPVTLDHPPEMVNSENWKEYAVGDTGDEVLRDGNSVRVPMMLRDSTAIKAFRNGTKQLSVGYDCGLVWKSGTTPEGEKYDAIQQGIHANHLAVVSAARGGPSLTIGDKNLHNSGDTTMNMRMILVDGLECQVPDTSAVVIQRTIAHLEQKLNDAKKALKEKDDEMEAQSESDSKKDSAIKARDKQLAEKTKEVETKDGEIAALKKQLEDAKKAASPQALDGLTRERAKVITKAQSLIGNRINVDGMSVEEIRRNVVQAKVGDCKDWSDDRVSGAFDAMQVNAFRGGGNAGYGGGNSGYGTVDHARESFGRPGAGYSTPAEQKDQALQEYNDGLINAWKGDQKTH